MFEALFNFPSCMRPLTFCTRQRVRWRLGIIFTHFNSIVTETVFNFVSICKTISNFYKETCRLLLMSWNCSKRHLSIRSMYWKIYQRIKFSQAQLQMVKVNFVLFFLMFFPKCFFFFLRQTAQRQNTFSAYYPSKICQFTTYRVNETRRLLLIK